MTLRTLIDSKVVETYRKYTAIHIKAINKVFSI